MKISWWLTVQGQRKPRNDKMRGPGLLWDATCSCGWDSDTGGSKMGDVRALVDQHKAEGHGRGARAAAEPGVERPEPIFDMAQIELQRALDLLAAIDRLPGPECVRRGAQDDAQRAFEIVAKAKRGGSAVEAETL